jgi:shikimate kinase
MKIYLIGYMGSGKSTLGKHLAKALGISWIDLDTEIEARYKISIPDFFTKYGEAAFRDVEHKVLNDVVQIPDVVVSTGGGVPCFHNNMELMNQNGVTIYLQATPEVILTRIGPYAWKRPLFQKMDGADTLEKIKEHLKSRVSFYQQAQIIIDAVNPNIDELKTLILNTSGITSSE